MGELDEQMVLVVNNGGGIASDYTNHFFFCGDAMYARIMGKE